MCQGISPQHKQNCLKSWDKGLKKYLTKPCLSLLFKQTENTHKEVDRNDHFRYMVKFDYCNGGWRNIVMRSSNIDVITLAATEVLNISGS